MFLTGIYFGGFQFESSPYNFLPTLNFYGIDIWEKKTFYNTIGAIFITATVIQGFGSSLFQSKFIQYLGRISFSIYLIHFLVLCSLSSYIYIRFPQNNIFLLLNFSAYVAVCFMVATFYEKFVDKKSIEISHKFSTKLFNERH